MMSGQSTWYLHAPDEGLQFLKEDKTDDAIYTIYLKKIRYHSSMRPLKSIRLQEANSTFYMQPMSEDNSRQHRWQLIEIKSIKFATIEILVKKLGFGSGEIDMSYVSAFLATFRTFTTAEHVLELIIYSYLNSNEIVEHDEQEFYQRTLKLVLSIWIEKYQEDFIQPPVFTLLHKILDFALETAQDVDLANKISNKLSLFSTDKSADKNDCLIELLFPLTLSILDYQLENISAQHFAEQLTLIDADLFKKLIPHECLGFSWSRRHEPDGAVRVRSVMATIEQFNRVTNRALADILQPVHLTKCQRGSIIERWISIAQELRMLKNFTSLKAIISAMQCNSVFRLKTVWSKINKDSMQVFTELSEMLSVENNHNLLRQILYREGTSKYAETKKHRRTQSWMCGNVKDTIVQTNQPTVGTVPYLGTFLTDLTMLDSAFANHLEEDPRLINFEKKKKEYEILTQIKLLQSSANLYSIRRDEAFHRAFSAMQTFSDIESYEYSCKIETQTTKYNTMPTKKKKVPTATLR